MGVRISAFGLRAILPMLERVRAAVTAQCRKYPVYG